MCNVENPSLNVDLHGVRLLPRDSNRDAGVAGAFKGIGQLNVDLIRSRISGRGTGLNGGQSFSTNLDAHLRQRRFPDAGILQYQVDRVRRRFQVDGHRYQGAGQISAHENHGALIAGGICGHGKSRSSQTVGGVDSGRSCRERRGSLGDPAIAPARSNWPAP
jgi:hypothetical protein